MRKNNLNRIAMILILLVLLVMLAAWLSRVPSVVGMQLMPYATIIEEADIPAAFENVRASTVRLHTSYTDENNIRHATYGSGIILSGRRGDPEPEGEIRILTAAHVVESARNADGECIAFFVTGEDAPFTVEFSDAATDDTSGITASPDVALITVQSSFLSESTFSSLLAVDIDTRTDCARGDAMFVIHSGNDEIADSYFAGTVESPRAYVETLKRNMLYCSCDAWPGMSGGAVFDAYGRFLGLLAGGTFETEVVAILPEDVRRAVTDP